MPLEPSGNGLAAFVAIETTMDPLPQVKTPNVRRLSSGKDQELYTGLSGPSYSLRGVDGKFKLPPPKFLQPGVDQDPGQLDSWPAHPIKPALSFPPGRRHKQPANVQRSVSAKIPDRLPIAPKPKFLEQLEAYLHREMKLLQCPLNGPNELRLQVHQEVFQYLIEDFKTYKPLLSSIKNEYELFIAYQQEAIKQFEPLKAQLRAVMEDCERRIVALRGEEKNEETTAWKENRRLQSVINQMRGEELSYKAQIEKLQEELSQLYEQYRNEADARKLLIGDYNDLKCRHQQEQQVTEETHNDEREDPVLLKLKLMRTREDLRTANQRINTMLADYGDVVPRREMEMLETSYKNLESEMEVLKNDQTVLMEEHNTLQTVYKQLVNERDKLSIELSELKRSATPRPRWDRCAQYIDGGQDRWSQLSMGRSSDQKVSILLAEIGGVSVSEVMKSDTFEGKGIVDEVPRYMRATGQIRNRHIDRYETNKLINGFWEFRYSSQEKSTQSLEDAFYNYLMLANNGNEAIAVEDAYNLLDSCVGLAHEPHVQLFHQTLTGQTSETVNQYWVGTLKKLADALKEESQKGIVNNSVVERVLQAILPSKPSNHTKALLDITSKCSLQDIADSLLKPASDGQPSTFAVCILTQDRRECKDFVQEIVSSLTNKSEVCLGEVRKVIQTLDPSKPDEELCYLLSRGFSISLQDIDGAGEITITLSKLTEMLNHGHTLRSGPSRHLV